MTATPETPWGENLCTNTSMSVTWPATAAARSACSARSTESRFVAPQNSQTACRPIPVASKGHLRRACERRDATSPPPPPGHRTDQHSRKDRRADLYNGGPRSELASTGTRMVVVAQLVRASACGAEG